MDDSYADDSNVERLKRSGILEGDVSEAQAAVINEFSREEVETLSSIIGKVKAAGPRRGVCFI